MSTPDQTRRTKLLLESLVGVVSSYTGHQALNPIFRTIAGEAYEALALSPATRACLDEYNAIVEEEERDAFVQKIAERGDEAMWELQAKLSSMFAQVEDQIRTQRGELDQIRRLLDPKKASPDAHSSESDVAAFPLGPSVPREWISIALVDALAANVSRHRAELIVLEASDAALSSGDGATAVRPWELPDIALSGAGRFWHEALNNACLHGPRMVAALMIVALQNTPSGPHHGLFKRLLERVGGMGR